MVRSSLGLSDTQLERLLTSAAALDQTPGLIRPITLNVIGTVLSAGGGTAPTLDAEKLIGSYIAQTLAQPAIRGHAPAVPEALITSFGTKRPMTEPDLQKVTHLRRGEVRAVLNGLAAAGMARPLDSAHAVWELSHDFIARAVARRLGRDGWTTTRRVLAYAAPLLVALTLSSVVVASVWFRLSPHQVRSQLADLGLTVSIEGGSASIENNSRFTPERFAEAEDALNRLNDASPIRSLALSETRVTNLEPLKNLKALTTLRLIRTEFKDLEPLKGLTALTSLTLYETPVTNLEPLGGLTALTALTLANMPLTDLEPLAGLTALTSLYVVDTRVTNLEPLRGLTALRSLDVSLSNVWNLEPLKNLAGLTRLTLFSTEVVNLEPLRGLTALTSLFLNQTKVENLEPLKNLTTLTDLQLSNTPVTDLKPLKGLTALYSLGLSDTRVTNLEPLKGLTALAILDLSRSRFGPEPTFSLPLDPLNLEPLKGLTGLTTLNLSNRPVTNIEALKGLTVEVIR